MISPRGILLGPTSIVGYAIARLGVPGLVPWANEHNRSPAAADWPRVALSEPDQVRAMLAEVQPAYVIYGDAVCDVPKCEADPDWARSINVTCLRHVLADLPRSCRLIYVSSDHVFGHDGFYDEADMPCPISVYGQTRVEAEALVQAWDDHLIIRPGLPIGVSIDGRTGHWDWLAYRQQRDLPITMIEDEARSAVWSDDLAQRIVAMAQSSVRGIRHIPATRRVDRVALAETVAQRQGLDFSPNLATREEQAHPHLGRVGLMSHYMDQWAEPLASPMDDLDRMPDQVPQPSADGFSFGRA